ncbi:chymotrypsin-1-like [Diachasmimorpha longicaudata]|uniref:chymotrypsin-1-like n=1 Tax=Diachasmimorpha longicaudata TaxID=58733 RepID=UPI0030B8F288
MVRMVPLALLLSLLLQADGGRVRRMTGGTEAPEHKYPYLVSFRQSEDPNQTDEYYHFCSGSILNKHWILTSASCFAKRNPKVTWAVVGTNNFFKGGDKYTIDRVIFHENYDKRYRDNIAVVRVAEEIQFNDNVQPVTLYTNEFTRYGETGTVAGWSVKDNLMLSDKLHEINLPIISNEECKKDRRGYITEMHICTYFNSTVGLCFEDIGGPLIFEGAQLGIASYAIPCSLDWPDVYTRVSGYLQWILDNAESAKTTLNFI